MCLARDGNSKVTVGCGELFSHLRFCSTRTKETGVTETVMSVKRLFLNSLALLVLTVFLSFLIEWCFSFTYPGQQDWIRPIALVVSGLFAIEWVFARDHGHFLWSKRRQNTRAKIAFAVGLGVLLILLAWPIQQRVESVWIRMALALLGGAIAGPIFHWFASPTQFRDMQQ